MLSISRASSGIALRALSAKAVEGAAATFPTIVFAVPRALVPALPAPPQKVFNSSSENHLPSSRKSVPSAMTPT